VQFDVGVEFDKKSEAQLMQARTEFTYERPNPYIHTFSGRANLPGGRAAALDNNNIVLRGCTLRITKYIIGVVIYSGYDSKIMLNSNKTRQKKSRLEFKMGIIVAAIFITQMLLTLLSAVLAASWSSSFLDLYDYLHTDVNFLYRNEIFTKWGSWVLLFTNFVPISLIVSLEMVKFIQGIYISRFRFDTQRRSEIVVQSSNLNEELGQIHHFFSDKTGTLTCNYMSFKYLVVKGRTYGDGEPFTPA
jgi:phospholipid-transporting ATPase